VELEPQILHRRVPIPLDVLDRAAAKLVDRAHPVRAHEPRDVRPLDVLGRRLPGQLGHAAAILRAALPPAAAAYHRITRMSRQGWAVVLWALAALAALAVPAAADAQSGPCFGQLSAD